MILGSEHMISSSWLTQDVDIDSLAFWGKNCFSNNQDYLQIHAFIAVFFKQVIDFFVSHLMLPFYSYYTVTVD